jgi:predicted small integral membrane protein
MIIIKTRVTITLKYAGIVGVQLWPELFRQCCYLLYMFIIKTCVTITLKYAGIVGVQLWAGLLRQRCYIDDHYQKNLIYQPYYKE